MTRENKSGEDIPASLEAQIAHLESRIRNRQQAIGLCASSCLHQFLRGLSSASALWSAGGVGYLIGMLTRRKSAEEQVREDTLPQKKSRLAGLLRSVALIRSILSTARFSAMWLFPEIVAASTVASEPGPTSGLS